MRFQIFFILYILALIPHSLETPWIYIGISAAIAAHAYLALSGYIKLLSPWATGIVSVAGLVFVLLDYHTLLGPEPATSLILILSALKLQELRSRRDGIIYLFLMSLVTMYYLLFSQTILSTLYMVMMSILIVIGFFILNTPREHLSRVLKMSPRLIGKDLLFSLPIFLILFIFFPRFSTPWASFIQDNKDAVGFSDTLEPGELGNLAQSREIAFHAFFKGNKIPPLSNLYWRGVTLENTNGWQWTVATKPQRRYGFDKNNTSNRTKSVRYEVNIEPRYKKRLFSLESTTDLAWDNKEMFNPMRTQDARTFSAEYPIVTRLKYRGQAQLESYFEEKISPDEKSLLLAIPKPSARTQQFVEGILTRASEIQTSRELFLAEQVKSYFSQEGFQYSMQTPEMKTVDAFLFDKRVGFCEHFASSFAALMRWMGVPSRVISGFQGADINDFGSFIIIRDQHAHSWVEIHDGRGWHRIDPTSAVNSMRISLGSLEQSLPQEFSGRGNMLRAWAARAELAFLALEMQYNQFLLNYNFQAQLDLFDLSATNLKKQKWLFFLVTLLLAAALYYLIFIFYNRRSTSDKLRKAYDELITKLLEHGLDVRGTDGPKTALQRAISKWPQQKHSLEQVFHIYITNRYAIPEASQINELIATSSIDVSGRQKAHELLRKQTRLLDLSYSQK